MEHKYMTLEEIIELSRKIDCRYDRMKAADLPEDEKNREAKKLSELIMELSVQLACYINNEIIGKLEVTNKSIPAIVAAARFVADSWEDLLNKDDPARLACTVVRMAMKSRLGTRAVSIDMNALQNNNAD